uniref:Peptidase M12A domain-containing protein n=1 Tax=Romanomermis culicivorax TaxID=13658 RepID=A0A915L6Z2_ROMCU
MYFNNEPLRMPQTLFFGETAIRERNFVNLALEYWQNGTCLNFELRDDVPHWNRVVFQKASTCDSMLGRLPGNDVQVIHLSDICCEKVYALSSLHASGTDLSIPEPVTAVGVQRVSRGTCAKESCRRWAFRTTLNTLLLLLEPMSLVAVHNLGSSIVFYGTTVVIIVQRQTAWE